MTKESITVLPAKIIINTPKELVWEVLKFPGEIQAFHPLVKNSRLTSAQKNGVGARRYCELIPMGEMEEEVTVWKEGQAIRMEVIGGKMLPPYHFMNGCFELFALGNQTEVHFTLTYQLKYGAMGQLMNYMMIRKQFRQAGQKALLGLKAYVEANQINHASAS